MNSTFKIIIIVLIGLFVIGGAFGYVNGWITGEPKHTHPPCNKLPSVSEATIAFNNHENLVKEIEELGDGIKVEVGKPCSDAPDKGLIQVNYNSKAERESIDQLLTQSKGFGVPVYLVKQ